MKRNEFILRLIVELVIADKKLGNTIRPTDILATAASVADVCNLMFEDTVVVPKQLNG